jgi:phosphatidylglycerophosphatase A
LRPRLSLVIAASRSFGLPFRHPAVLLATWFGAGLLPVTPGSWGAFAALPVAWAVRARSGLPGLAVAAAIVFFVGWWAASRVAAASGVEDPGAVVIDEVAGQWLVLLAAPPDLAVWAIAFVLFRIFDIGKPWPVGWADRHVHGGLGIMLDDVLAAGYAALVLSALTAIAGIYGVRA